MKILFLDFDGVLNSEKYLKRSGSFGVALDPERMALLRGIIDKTGAKIVLTTSWREYWEKESDLCQEAGREINRFFGEFGLSVFDKTQKIGKEREGEIEAWLEANPETEKFAVLDDRFLDSKIIREHFVKTDNYKNGLSREDAQRVIEILE